MAFYDVLIAGGGSAGCAAAVAAARHGARVLLIERYGFLGGTGASVLDTFYGFYTPGEQRAVRQVVGGIGSEVVEQLSTRDRVLRRPNTYGAGTGITYNPEVLKTVWEALVTEARADLLLHTSVLGIRGTGGEWEAELATRTGRRTVRAGILVDASGDAQIATWAGAAYDMVEPSRLQALTTTFRVVNVDAAAARQISHRQLVQLMDQARADGFDLPRRDGSIHATTISGSMVANMVRIGGRDPLDPEDLTSAEIDGRRQVAEYVRFLRERVPGYSQADLVWSSVHIGIRESRRIIGDYTLTREDVMSARQFDDAIALCGAPIEDHTPGADTEWEYLPPGSAVGIPLTCLLPRGMDGILVAGRCLSATHDAHAAVRSMGQCMAMGQAAGTAAAAATQTGWDIRSVDRQKLRAELQTDGAIIV